MVWTNLHKAVWRKIEALVSLTLAGKQAWIFEFAPHLRMRQQCTPCKFASLFS